MGALIFFGAVPARRSYCGGDCEEMPTLPLRRSPLPLLGAGESTDCARFESPETLSKNSWALCCVPFT